MGGSEIGKRIQKYFESYIKIVILNAAFPTIFYISKLLFFLSAAFPRKV